MRQAAISCSLLQCILFSTLAAWILQLQHGCTHRLPVAEILPGMGRASVMAPDGSMLNTCATDVLIEVLRYLKRAYWPFPWETGMGDCSPGEWAGGSGFLGAAQVCAASMHLTMQALPSDCAQHAQLRLHCI